jgi:AraC family transcriptional regulator, alkane utilization regulator
MDVLSDVLRIIRLTGSIFFTAKLSSPYSIASPPANLMLKHMKKEGGCVSLFHILTEGTCWFKKENGPSFQLTKGTAVIFPHGSSHVMCSNTDIQPRQLLSLMSFEQAEKWNKVAWGGNGEITKFICGFHLCDQKFNPLLGAIPEVLILANPESSAHAELFQHPQLQQKVVPVAPGSWLDTSLQQLIKEATNGTVGSATMTTRLTELLFVEIIRRYINALPEKTNGWLAGIRDAEIGKALEFFHANPEKKWNVEDLASKVGVSRSAFAQRFCDLVGEPPMKYLTGWRMQLAKHYLLYPDLSLAMIAEKVGYDSDIAFSRAFKRYAGEPPAYWREHALLSS